LNHYSLALHNQIKSVDFVPEMTNPDAILVRSAKMYELEIGDNLKAVGRAGAHYRCSLACHPQSGALSR
jgi:hypothetical protein